MKRVVRLLRSAERDIAQGMAWYRVQQAGLEHEFLNEVDNAVKRISRRPTHYAKRLNDYRAVLVRRFPFTVYYRLVGKEIRIAAILHHKRGSKARRSRLVAGATGRA